MIYIFKTNKQMDAGQFRDQIHAQIAQCDHNDTVRHTKEGKHTNGKLEHSARPVYFSPKARKSDGTPITLDDFPDEFSFGNGVTSNARVVLKDGTCEYLSWCIFPNTLPPQDVSNLEAIF